MIRRSLRAFLLDLKRVKFAIPEELNSLLTEFQEHINEFFPELLSGKSLLALSGGLDSMVLFHLMQSCDLDFSLAHCNFQLRGESSDQDQLFVQKEARICNKACFTKKFDTSAYAQKKGISIQMAARELRYEWFRELMKRENLDFLVTAHHGDDNLETFLINLSRGSGLKGLTGIPEKSNDIFRPLLRFSREEILAYAKNNDISWREDPSNKDAKYLRNAIRMELIPAMKNLLPGIMESFQNTIGHLRDSNQLVEDRMAEIEEQVVEPFQDDPMIKKYRIDAIQKLPDPRAYIYPLFSPYGFTQWEDIFRLMSGQTGKMVYSDTHRLIRDRKHLLLEKLGQDNSGSDIFELDKGCSELLLPGASKKILVQRFPTAPGKDPLRDDRSVLYVDEELLQYPLVVRKWKNGDYFYPEGMMGRKKLSKFFKDEKFSIPEKENIWLLCAGNEIVWIIGRRADRRFAPTDQSRKILKIEIEKLL